MDALPQYEVTDLNDLFTAREHYLASGELIPGVRPVVAESWRRTRAYALDPRQLRLQTPDPQILARARADARALDEHGASLLEEMHELLGTAPHLLALGDQRGRILRLLASGMSHATLHDANLFEGASWHERDIGCNGVGTALAVAGPVVLIGPEHVQEAYVGWTCIGVPVWDSRREIAGVIDLSVPNEVIDVRTWGWVLSVARVLELRLRFDDRVPVPTKADLEDALADPLSAARGVLDLLGGQLSTTLPSHDRLVHEGLSSLVDVETRLREVVARSAELEGMLSDARRATDRKLAEVAHEMRNPIGAISAAVALLEHTGANLEGSRVVDVIRRQLTVLTRLATDLSDQRAGGQLTSLQPRAIDLRRVVEDATSTVASEITKRRHALHVRLPDEPLTLEGDPVRLGQALVNLLTNAAKYTRPGGHIELSCSREMSEIVVAVRDSGRGIPPGQLSQIFDPCARTIQAHEEGIDGRGLGLALVQEIVERHGGRVSAQSEGPNRGSVFTLWIPARCRDATDSARQDHLVMQTRAH